MSLKVEILSEAERREAIASLAALRIEVFREFPYLYDGSIAYEIEYLAQFAQSPNSVLVAASDGETLIGAATASPVNEQSEDFVARIKAAGIDPDSAFYFGESVLLTDYRGQGIGHAFFDRREDTVRQHGAKVAIFASVVRPADHPARPDGYRSLEPFWSKRGYAPVPGLLIEMSWKEVGEGEESPKRLQCWMKRLD